MRSMNLRSTKSIIAGTGAVLTAALVLLALSTASDSVAPGWMTSAASAQSSVRPPDSSSKRSEAPAGKKAPAAAPAKPPNSSQIWRSVKQGARGYAPSPNKDLGLLQQNEGMRWLAIRNGPLAEYGAWLLLAVVVLLALFFAVRRQIKVSAGLSGEKVKRFSGLERFTHWMTAVAFIVLGLTGLNLLYGKDLLLPLIGGDAFAFITLMGKYAHNYVAFPFMIGLVLMVILWIGRNLPNRHDFVWLAKGGGMFSKNVHPPAAKFNAGQKIVFWGVILVGTTISVSGIYLMLPGALSIADQQWIQLWHAAASLVLIALIIAHIYIGTIGMQGAVGAMWSGEVDKNWAKEHHSIWYEKEVAGKTGGPEGER